VKVILCGAGQVGFNIARHLSTLKNDVTVIDRSASLIRKISESLDVQAIQGHASDPAMLERAGGVDADMLVAVTMSDEVNMVACQVAHSLFQTQTKIARIRNPAYLKTKWADMFSRDNIPIDVIISPEMEVANALVRRLQVPGAFNMVPFVGDRVRVIGLTLDPDCPVVETPLRQLSELFPALGITVIAVSRAGKVFVPRSDDSLQIHDQVYFAVDADMTRRAMSVFGHDEKAANRIVIVGGGNIGTFLAQKLEEEDVSPPQIKLIEVDHERARKVASQLSKTVVLNGDALERDILLEANIEDTDTIVAVADDDEVNILSSLLAKREGCRQAIALLNNQVYNTLVGGLGIDVALDPRETTVSSIVRHIRRGRIRDLYSLAEGTAEIFEAEVLEGSRAVGQRIGDLKLRADIRFGMIVREDVLVFPEPSTRLEVGDFVVVLALSDAVTKLETLFSAGAELF